MRNVSSRALEMSLSRGSMRRVSREVRLAMDECGVPVLLMPMRRMSTSVPSQWLRMAFARGVHLARINWAVWERLWSAQYFHSRI
jgi:L-asparaginase II